MSKPKAQSVDNKHDIDTVAEMSKNETQAQSVDGKHEINTESKSIDYKHQINTEIQSAGDKHKIDTASVASRNEAKIQSVGVKHKIDTVTGLSKSEAQTQAQSIDGEHKIDTPLENLNDQAESSATSVKSEQAKPDTQPKHTVEKQAEVSDRSPENSQTDASTESAATKKSDKFVTWAELCNQALPKIQTTNATRISDLYNMPERYARFLHPPCALNQHTFDHLEDLVSSILEQRVLKNLEDGMQSTMKQQTQVNGTTASDQMQTAFQQQAQMYGMSVSNLLYGRSATTLHKPLVPAPATSGKLPTASNGRFLMLRDNVKPKSHNSASQSASNSKTFDIKTGKPAIDNASVIDLREIIHQVNDQKRQEISRQWKNLTVTSKPSRHGSQEQRLLPKHIQEMSGEALQCKQPGETFAQAFARLVDLHQQERAIKQVFRVHEDTLDDIDRKQGILKDNIKKLSEQNTEAQEENEKLEREKQATSQLLSNAGIDMKRLRAKYGPKM